MTAKVETDVLIVGAGPAGASSAVFLGKHGIANMVISRHRSTAVTPRAHITNQRTMEAMRDVGLERQCMERASPPEFIENSIWLRTMAGEEIARVYAWGNDPLRKGDYEAASPCKMCDLPQNVLEPILVSEAARLGSHVRFSMELLSFQQHEHGVTALVRDRVTGGDVEIRAKYMIGADGARSRVVEQLGIPLVGTGELGSFFSVFCEADLTDYVHYRRASLYICVKPSPKWIYTNIRMTRPWDQWLASIMLHPNERMEDVRPEEIEARVRECIGAPVPVKILNVAKWSVNELVASHYSVGRVFCIGDAVHRHSPGNGLGSNTSVQDAFNLSWKLALVLENKADPSLLDSFGKEREPVGRQIVRRANDTIKLNYDIYNFILGDKDKPMSATEYAEFLGTSAGRDGLRRILHSMRYETHAHGVELNRQYASGAVIDDGTPPLLPERDAQLFYQPSTKPGAPLPHVWLGHRTAGPLVSSLDVAGKQRFTVITGPGGDRWRDAAALVSEQTGVEIAVVSIGPFMDYEDTYGCWSKLAEIEENGCVLVRPDLYIGWRCTVVPADPHQRLSAVMQAILGLTTPKEISVRARRGDVRA
jgi:2,4-dichlorophenol 6-monooxygenase